MVGDGQVLHSERIGRLRHLLDRMPAVRIDGVTVDQSADILPGDQIGGQRSTEGGLDFSFIFP